jgi:hypothetical protein
MGMDESGSGLFEVTVLNDHRGNAEETMGTLGKLYCL